MSELASRVLTGAAMIAVALAAAIVGGYFFAVLVAALATLMFYEWTRLVKGWGAAWSVGGFFYALIPALALLWIRDRADHGLMLLLWLFIVTWAVDIGGYFVGKTYGKRKLAPSISPGKTWEGLYGGVAAATLLGGLWAMATSLPITLLLLAPVFAVAAQIGDLAESKMKRIAKVKDSGDLLPGHGGILDRLDGLVPVAVLTLIAEVAGLA